MKIQTYSELKARTDLLDFLEFGDFSPDNIGIFHQLFAEHKILTDTNLLLSDLVLLLFEVLRGPERRMKKSSNEINFPRNIRKAYIQRLEVLAEDPVFASQYENIRGELEQKIQRFKSELKDLSKPNAKRGGQTKILVNLLVPVIIRLKVNNLERPQRVSFLHDLIVVFESPEFGGTKQKSEKDRIRQWDREATKLSESRPTIMGVTFNK